MNKDIKRIELTHHEMLELLAIVGAIKQSAAERRNKSEVKLMNELTRRLLTYDLDVNSVLIELDNMSRFSLWMCVDKYADFCSETHQLHEYALAVTISTKLSN